MEKRIDLHVHSNISDGSSSIKELLEIALYEKISAISLTDHDNIGGLKDAKAIFTSNNIEFVNGIEFSSLYKNNRIIHILGIGIDIDNSTFLNEYIKMKKAREDNIKLILNNIGKQGIKIDIYELRKNAKEKYLDRYDIYRYFTKNKICNNAKDIWDKYLDVIPYGENELIKAEDAISIIKEAGGVSFLAHYNKKIGFQGFTNNQIEYEIKYLKSIGLDGIEKYYPTFKDSDYEFLDYIINKYSLMISGGTDFHGSNRPEIKMGRGENDNLFIPYTIYENIIKKL